MRSQAILDHWYSHRLGRWVGMTRWGWWGTPVLMFPTAGGDALEIDRFKVLHVLQPLIDRGKIKLYSVDNVPGQELLFESATAERCSDMFCRFAPFVADEVATRIDQDCQADNIEIIAAGASLGAFHALSLAARFPQRVRSAVCLSPTFELAQILDGFRDLNLYYASPLYFLGRHPEDATLRRLRTRELILAQGSGRWENPRHVNQMHSVLAAREIPHQCHNWGPRYAHDWPTWRTMMPYYLEKLAGPC